MNATEKSKHVNILWEFFFLFLSELSRPTKRTDTDVTGVPPGSSLTNGRVVFLIPASVVLLFSSSLRSPLALGPVPESSQDK